MLPKLLDPKSVSLFHPYLTLILGLFLSENCLGQPGHGHFSGFPSPGFLQVPYSGNPAIFGRLGGPWANSGWQNNGQMYARRWNRFNDPYSRMQMMGFNGLNGYPARLGGAEGRRWYSPTNPDRNFRQGNSVNSGWSMSLLHPGSGGKKAGPEMLYRHKADAETYSMGGASRTPDQTANNDRTGTYQLLQQRAFFGSQPQQFVVRRRRPDVFINQAPLLSRVPEPRIQSLNIDTLSLPPTTVTVSAETSRIRKVSSTTPTTVTTAESTRTTEATPRALPSCKKTVLISRVDLFKPETLALLTPGSGLCLQFVD
ncbi:hypothetical protein RvY_07576 [Ramazzottius varieornatus]|uniref:Uncharacterized protein n=1 Tax=Ramazzottius varieornatus TaxID=947166 RepID=A0A1D1V2P6_RAMVA|nr:hypothetical protein RvY_07576 [Ramazzottius varieornatus]